MTQIINTEKRRPGRPCIRNWAAERDTIELLIRSGYGVLALARHYGISKPGMLKVLQRLGIVTLYQAADKEGRCTTMNIT